jgi:membrane fusion protein (multidrug efflux system)
VIVKIVMFALLLAAAGCDNEAETSVVAAPPVMVVRVDEHLIVDRIQVTGDLLAKEEASVAAEVSGHVTGVLADEGDAVEAGDAVMEIDPERRHLQLEHQRARLEEAEAQLAEQERETKRVRSLYSRNVASQSQLDQAELQLRLARAGLRASRAELGLVSRALRDASVSAPFSGLIARRYASVGEFVSVGQPLFDLVALDPIEVEFRVPERDASRVSLGQRIDVRVAPFPDEVFSALVSVISPRIDVRTRTLRIKGLLANDDGRLRPGFFVRADLGVSERSSIPMVPEDAILQRADGAIVFRLVEGNRVERRSLVTGVFKDGYVEVVDGLEIGDRVVVRGQTALVEGAVVSLRDHTGAPSTPEVAAGGARP